MIKQLLIGAAVGALMLGTGSAWSSVLLSPSAPDSSLVITPGIITVTNGAAVPWTAEFYANTNECLRIAVTAQSADLLMTAVDNNSDVYRDDNSGGSSKPLLRINPVNRASFFSVQVTQRLGQAVNATFTIQAQRLPLNSPSCLPASFRMVYP